MDEFVQVCATALGFFGGEYILQFLAVGLVFIPCPKRKLWGVRYIVCVAAVLVLGKFLPVPAPWYYIVFFIIFTAMNAVIYRYNCVQVLFISVCMYCLQHFASDVSYAVVYLIIARSGDMELFWLYFVIMPAIYALTMLAAWFTMIKKIKSDPGFRFNNTLIVFVSCAFLFMAAMLTYYMRNGIWNMYILSALMVIAALFTVLVVIVSLMNVKTASLEQENIILLQLLNKDRQHYEQTKLSNEKIQIKYHDLKKMQNDGIINYQQLSEINADKEILLSTYFTGNTALDVVLSEKALMCERLGIRFICTADGNAVSFIKPYHIYSFMLNAIENCIESVQSRSDRREVEVSIVRKGNISLIKTCNYTDIEKLELYGGVPRTTKKDKCEHGFGVKSMKNIAEIYGGTIRFYVEDHNFVMIAMIPVPEPQRGNNVPDA